MSLQTKIVEEWKQALKNRDAKKDALSMIITELKNRAIKDNVTGGEGRVVSDEIAFDVLQKMAKQRREAIEAYRLANRADLVEKEQQELNVVEYYLPKALNDDELKAIVSRVIAQTGATDMKNMGVVMSESMKAVEGRADGKRIQVMVQSLLGQR